MFDFDGEFNTKLYIINNWRSFFSSVFISILEEEEMRIEEKEEIIKEILEIERQKTFQDWNQEA